MILASTNAATETWPRSARTSLGSIGVGDIELLTALRHRMGDRLIFIGGMPTAEVHASAAAAVGMTTYSSAIYNFRA
jgi:hypothetical protein